MCGHFSPFLSHCSFGPFYACLAPFSGNLGVAFFFFGLSYLALFFFLAHFWEAFFLRGECIFGISGRRVPP